MWTADAGRRRRTQGGFTFIEVTAVLAFTAVLALVVERAVHGANEADQYLSAVRRALEQHHRLGLGLRDGIGPSRRIFHADGIGEAYLAACDLSLSPLAPGARLPVIDETQPLGPDAKGDPHTGNVLLVAREGDPLPCAARPATQGIRAIDTFRFVCVYPSETSVRLDPYGAPARDLVVWWSRPYPSVQQLLSIEDAAERAACVRDLVARFQCDVGWDPSAPLDAAFFTLDPTGSISAIPDPAPVIEEDLDVSEGGRLVHRHIQLSRTDGGSARQRSVFTADAPADWVPDGFEVKVVGPSGARRVWVRVCIEASAGQGRMAGHDGALIVDVRDM